MKKSTFVNSSWVIDLEFVSPVNLNTVKSDKHKWIIKWMLDSLLEFKHLYES